MIRDVIGLKQKIFNYHGNVKYFLKITVCKDFLNNKMQSIFLSLTVY